MIDSVHGEAQQELEERDPVSGVSVDPGRAFQTRICFDLIQYSCVHGII